MRSDVSASTNETYTAGFHNNRAACVVLQRVAARARGPKLSTASNPQSAHRARDSLDVSFEDSAHAQCNALRTYPIGCASPMDAGTYVLWECPFVLSVRSTCDDAAAGLVK